MKPVAPVTYSPALDGIRALAALVVVVHHARVPGSPGGFFGVDVFFVLSGYLITRLLIVEHEREGCLRLGHFLIRRLRRLLPALLLMLAAYLLLAPWIFPDVMLSKHFRDAVLTALYVVNYAAYLGGFVSELAHVWSLAVEMHFYLLWPVVLLGILRLPRRLAIAVIASLYIAATAWRWWGAENFATIWTFYVRTDTHCSGLLLGCLLGLLECHASPLLGDCGAAVAGICDHLLQHHVDDYRALWLYHRRTGSRFIAAGPAALVGLGIAGLARAHVLWAIPMALPGHASSTRLGRE